MTDLDRIDWELRNSAYHADRLIGELGRLEAYVRDPVDELALITVRAWAQQIKELVHDSHP